MKAGERYYYLQGSYDLIIEIKEFVDTNKVYVIVLQRLAGPSANLGPRTWAWDTTIGAWEYLPGQDNPHD